MELVCITERGGWSLHRVSLVPEQPFERPFPRVSQGKYIISGEPYVPTKPRGVELFSTFVREKVTSRRGWIGTVTAVGEVGEKGAGVARISQCVIHFNEKCHPRLLVLTDRATKYFPESEFLSSL